jgi:NAD kinase
MKPNDVVIFRKFSKRDWDASLWNMNDAELTASYRSSGLSDTKIARIFASHAQQVANFSRLRDVLGTTVPVIDWTPPHLAADPQEVASNERLLRTAPLVIALGGDETFKYVAEFRQSGIILGLNSDPGPSKGKLLAGSVADFELQLDRFWKDELAVEPWVRLDTYLDNVLIGRASNQVFIGADDPEIMSRYVIELPDARREEQKSSGVLITTGAGSTGWYRSARNSIAFDFPRNEQAAEFYVREPQRNDDNSTFSLLSGRFLPGEKLLFHSLHARGGRVSIDCKTHRDEHGQSTFNEGRVAKICLSDSPLRVLTLTPA